MNEHELETDTIIAWAVNYAGYDELETVAKSLYALYVERRKKEHPEAHNAIKKYKKKQKGYKK